MAKAKETNFWNFILSFTSSWLTGMSGALSVPFAIVAIFVSNILVKTLWLILAFCAFVFAAYRVWSEKNNDILKAQEEIEDLIADGPSVSMTFDYGHNVLGRPSFVTITNSGNQPAAHVKVDDIVCPSGLRLVFGEIDILAPGSTVPIGHNLKGAGFDPNTGIGGSWQAVVASHALGNKEEITFPVLISYTNLTGKVKGHSECSMTISKGGNTFRIFTRFVKSWIEPS